MRHDPHTSAACIALAELLDSREPYSPEPCACGCGTPWHPRCTRCALVASLAEKRGDPIPPIELVETWIGWAGRRYFAGLCVLHTDMAWSERWDERWIMAKGNTDKIQKLLELARAWEGIHRRRYLGVKRPGGPTAAPAPKPDARTGERDDEDDHSLIPRGYR